MPYYPTTHAILLSHLPNLTFLPHRAHGSGPALKYHGKDDRGTTSLFLGREAGTEKEEPIEFDGEKLMEMEVRMENVTVPVAADAYVCMRFRMPVDKKYHGLRQEAIITSKHVHHMFVVACEQDDPTWEYNVPFSCGMVKCSRYMSSWSPGGLKGGFTRDKDVGLPFGKGEAVSFVLEIHYNNAEKLENVIDSSGFKFGYTDNLRKHDLGYLMLGTYASSPALKKNNAEVFRMAPNLCPSACTSKFPADLSIFETLTIHMHKLGSGGAITHVRNGTEIGYLAEKRHNDFNLQGGVPLSDPKEMMRRGDAFVTQCVYSPTIGHPDAEVNIEMCNIFIPVYPRMRDIEVCMQFPETRIASCTTMDQIVAHGGSSKSLLEAGLAVNITDAEMNYSRNVSAFMCHPSNADPSSWARNYVNPLKLDATTPAGPGSGTGSSSGGGIPVAVIAVITILGAFVVAGSIVLMHLARKAGKGGAKAEGGSGFEAIAGDDEEILRDGESYAASYHDEDSQ